MFKNKEKVQNFLAYGISQCRVLVLGDVMLDRYYFGDVKRISPEAPVPVALINGEKTTLGGAANVALNLFYLGCQTKLAGVIGEDINGDNFYQMMNALHMETAGLVRDQTRPTTTKMRIFGGHQQMLRLDFENKDEIAKKLEKRIRTYVEKSFQEGLDCIIISDYDKGICSSALCRYIIKRAREEGIYSIVDPKGKHWNKYAGASFITPNIKELGDVFNTKLTNDDQVVEKAGEKLRKKFHFDSLVATRSEKGMSIINEAKTLHIPTLAQEVFDVSGAGDTVIATFGAALAGHMEILDAALLANLAAGVVVEKLGTYPIHIKELIRAAELRADTDIDWKEGNV